MPRLPDEVVENPNKPTGPSVSDPVSDPVTDPVTDVETDVETDNV